MDDEISESTSCSELRWDAREEILWCLITVRRHTSEEARENIAGIARVRDRVGREKVRVLVDMRKAEAIERDARVFYASEYTASIERAIALVTGNTVARVMANFFMNLNKPVSPTRMFNTTEAAVEWLRGFTSA